MIAFDPGTVTGWAVFLDGKLSSADTLKKGDLHEVPWIELLPAIVVIEKPVVYVRGRGSKGDPNEIVELGVWAGELCGVMKERTRYRTDSVYVTPRRWKGTVPKEIGNERTLEQLEPDELELLPRRPRAKDFDHNMLDAVGLGLWQLQRERQRE